MEDNEVKIQTEKSCSCDESCDIGCNEGKEGNCEANSCENNNESNGEVKDEASELKNSLQRLQAEFENYKKRVDREKEEFVKFSNSELVSKLIIVIDDFELAIRNCKEKNEFYSGIELVFANFMKVLNNEGLVEIEAEGQKFDPVKHEAMLTEESDKESGIVLEVLQKGFMMGEQVIRTSKVKVSK